MTDNASEPVNPQDDELEALKAIFSMLQALDAVARQRVLAAVGAYYGVSIGRDALRSASAAPQATNDSSFSTDRAPGPKEFLFEKRPQTDVDRIACLAYYLTHYRDTPHFKTLDLSKLNTEAAQLKFSNPAQAVDNAAKSGLLVPASKGAKQLSRPGELYVEALPDRLAAREVLLHAKPKRKPRKAGGWRPVSPNQEESE